MSTDQILIGLACLPFLVVCVIFYLVVTGYGAESKGDDKEDEDEDE